MVNLTLIFCHGTPILAPRPPRRPPLRPPSEATQGRQISGWGHPCHIGLIHDTIWIGNQSKDCFCSHLPNPNPNPNPNSKSNRSLKSEI